MNNLLKTSIKNLPYLQAVFQERDRLRSERNLCQTTTVQLQAYNDQLRAECASLRAECERLRSVSQPPPPALNFKAGLASVLPDEHSLLRRMVKETNHLTGPIIEIGTLIGATTARMALWKSPERKIITVDNYYWNPWGFSSADHQAITAQMLFYLIQSKQVEVVVMGKNEFYDQYEGESPSLVFLDAVHDYEETRRDIEWAKSVNAQVISGHDYSDQFPGVMQAVKEFGGPRHLNGTVFVL